MGVDLNLVNRVWKEAKEFAVGDGLPGLPSYTKDIDVEKIIPYPAALMIVSCLLANKKLAEEIVAESWENIDGNSGS